uniref:Uncharacterized protein n=1 Tax=Myoviridae sp. ctFCq8 TaxID=2827605 RepID=A0A8S5LIE6_9CAUD|nr:MAG TPA: hypothetical protein [Myoviridae sp. ctFCq8]DAN75660.1 MAG TPA: hypothetical protein [Caudoviricetes sp.]DAR49872.1 MAG TPA: hypothetical protein [Caudoviricetes sp.]
MLLSPLEFVIYSRFSGKNYIYPPIQQLKKT